MLGIRFSQSAIFNLLGQQLAFQRLRLSFVAPIAIAIAIAHPCWRGNGHPARWLLNYAGAVFQQGFAGRRELFCCTSSPQHLYRRLLQPLRCSTLVQLDMPILCRKSPKARTIRPNSENPNPHGCASPRRQSTVDAHPPSGNARLFANELC